jgi:hypothetical protein
MHHQKGSMLTPEPSRILTRLCFHFRKKIEVQYDEHEGLAHFPWGDCRLTAREGELDFDCSAATPEQLGRVKFVIDEHVALFSRKAPLTVRWQVPRTD